MKFESFLIECITNLHVGSGDSNYGIVDNLVQRDPVSGHPTIHATSLKGGLKEHFNKLDSTLPDFKRIFGDDDSSGNVKFLSADLVALPVRATYDNYVLAISKKQWEELNEKSTILTGRQLFDIDNLKEENLIFADSQEEIYAEDFKLTINTGKKPGIPCFSTLANFAQFTTDNFSELTKRLPVIARNRIVGNKNLWYEEFVPHKSLFLTFVGTNSEDEAFLTSLNNSLIQIGANSSVGYGLCKFTKIGLQK